MHKIYWIASYPKSGNTWVRFLLTAYKFGYLNINDNIPYVHSDINRYHYQSVSPVALKDLPELGVLLLRYPVVLHMLTSSRFRPAIFKTHFVRKIVGDVNLFPRAFVSKAIYIIRDPRDCIVSYSRHTGISIDDAIRHTSDHNAILRDDSNLYSWLSSWSDHVKSWEKDDTLIIKYEDLKENTEMIFRKILEHLEMDIDKQKIKKTINLCNLERFMKQEEQNGFLEVEKQIKFFGQGKGWINELLKTQIMRIQDLHHDVMEQYGYQLMKD